MIVTCPSCRVDTIPTPNQTCGFCDTDLHEAVAMREAEAASVERAALVTLAAHFENHTTSNTIGGA